MDQMKILIVASDFPWPKVQGGHLRLTTAIEVLATLGQIDLFAPYDCRRTTPTLPPTVPVDRLKTVGHRGSSRQLRWRAAWLARRGTPLEVAMWRTDATSRHEFESWVADQYDLVWFERAATFDWMGRPHLGPTIVDLVDLEDEKARARAQIIYAQLSRTATVSSVRQAMAVAQARLNARDWRQFQRSVASGVDRVVLSSDLDARRSDLANAVVVPNTYERPEARAVGCTSRSGNRPSSCSRPASTTPRTWTRSTGWSQRWRRGSEPGSQVSKSDLWARLYRGWSASTARQL